MTNDRVNCFVSGKYPDLRDHLSSYGRAAGERLKLLATLGAVVPENVQVDPAVSVPRADGNKKQVLRLNPRISGAFSEITDELQGASSRGGQIVRLAARGLAFMQSPELFLQTEKKGLSVDQAAQETGAGPAESNDDDLNRIGLAAGLFSEDTLWR
ncbi:hypothetical protein [Marinobacter salicampi]|uniref:hypothetical protein n=1 Tax=Marinobacter salicampi TaxID=435907 RepID=UPI00140DE5FD|nr:hypothetical protein [Marinobacter salicampi]